MEWHFYSDFLHLIRYMSDRCFYWVTWQQCNLVDRSDSRKSKYLDLCGCFRHRSQQTTVSVQIQTLPGRSTVFPGEGINGNTFHYDFCESSLHFLILKLQELSTIWLTVSLTVTFKSLSTHLPETKSITYPKSPCVSTSRYPWWMIWLGIPNVIEHCWDPSRWWAAYRMRPGMICLGVSSRVLSSLTDWSTWLPTSCLGRDEWWLNLYITYTIYLAMLIYLSNVAYTHNWCVQSRGNSSIRLDDLHSSSINWDP